MTAKELIESYADGNRDFRSADLRRANLCNAYLNSADLNNADLRSADLRRANLCNAYLNNANLSGANLSGANLRGANLRNAYLNNADLRDANLSGANLSGANLRGAKDFPAREIAKRQIVPAAGHLHVWKKLSGGSLCQLLIPDGTPRVGGIVGRKCRAELAVVVAGEGVSSHDGVTIYTPGVTVIAENWDPNPLVECSGGIHFFLTREEAEDY